MEIKDFSGSKSVKVNCSFCGKGIECPKHMVEESKKHMCYECFITYEPNDEEIKDVHVDMPMDKVPEFIASEMTDKAVEEAFPIFWSERRYDLKGMSKKDLAREAFNSGIYIGIMATIKTGMEEMRSDQSGSLSNKEKSKKDS